MTHDLVMYTVLFAILMGNAYFQNKFMFWGGEILLFLSGISIAYEFNAQLPVSVMIYLAISPIAAGYIYYAHRKEGIRNGKR